jgi:hydroxymethylglutaryl-CoA reductase (NADPH)
MLNKSSADRIPIYLNNDYNLKNIKKRARWIENIRRIKLKHILNFSEPTNSLMGNIEHPIGFAKIPIGLAGPLHIKGSYAKGHFLIPLATTEGVLVTSYHNGMIILNKSGGVRTYVIKDLMHISPIFVLNSLDQKNKFTRWVKDNFSKIKEVAESTTNKGKLVSIEKYYLDNSVILKFVYNVADAMGMNMICKATLEAVIYISKQTGVKDFFIRSNFSSDKKVSLINIKQGYGKSVFATAIIKRKYFELLGVTPEQVYKYYRMAYKVSKKCKMIGVNGQFANGLASLFIACGQDVASIINSAVGVSLANITKDRDLKVSVYLPNLVLGTVGGGTGLGTQKECLNILGCYGSGKAKKFAEIVAATLLAGEITIVSSIVAGTFVSAHERLGRNRPS